MGKENTLGCERKEFSDKVGFELDPTKVGFSLAKRRRFQVG